MLPTSARLEGNLHELELLNRLNLKTEPCQRFRDHLHIARSSNNIEIKNRKTITCILCKIAKKWEIFDIFAYCKIVKKYWKCKKNHLHIASDKDLDRKWRILCEGKSFLVGKGAKERRSESAPVLWQWRRRRGWWDTELPLVTFEPKPFWEQWVSKILLSSFPVHFCVELKHHKIQASKDNK